VTDAIIHIYAKSEVGDLGKVHEAAFVVDNDWQETGITWSTKPTSSTVLGTWTDPTPDSWVNIDVSQSGLLHLPGDGMLSVRIYPQETNAVGWVEYSSKDGSDPPTLEVNSGAFQGTLEADAYVHSGTDTTNYGSYPVLRVQRGPGQPDYRESFLRFDLSGISVDGCPDGYVCGALTSVCQPQSTFDPCAHVVCPDGQSCNQTTSLCVP